MKPFKKSASIMLVLTILFLLFLTPVSALTRDDIVETANSQMGAHYLWGTHDEKPESVPIANFLYLHNTAETCCAISHGICITIVIQ